MNQFEKMKLGGASASSLKGSASANVAVYPTSSSKSATSLVSKVVFLMLTLVLALTLSVGSAYASSDSNSDNDTDVSDETSTFIHKSDFENSVYTITNGGIYKLAEDIENGQIKVYGDASGDKITLDLNGHTLTNKTKDTQALYVFNEEPYITYDISLEVIDSDTKKQGAIIADSASENTAIRIGSNSYHLPEVTLNGVKVTSYASECIACVHGDLTINDATLQTEDEKSALIYGYKEYNSGPSTIITINSGSFTAGAYDAFKFSSEGHGAPDCYVKGGTFNRPTISGYLDEGKSVWKTDAGYVVGNTSEKSSDYIYKAVLPGSGVLWFSSTDDAEKFAEDYTGSTGTEVHKISFTNEGGESEDKIPAQYVVDGCRVIEPDALTSDDYKFNGWKNGTETYNFENEVTSDLTLTADWSLYVVQVGDKKFASVEDAITNSSSGDTVKLIQDIEGQINVTHTHEVTLDLNGYTVKNSKSGTAVVIDRSSSAAGYLTVTDSADDGKKGAIIQEATNAVAIRLDDKSPLLKLDGITVETVSSECLQVNNGTVELNNVVMSTQQKANSLIYTKSSNGVEINSGTYTAADGAALITEVDGGAGTKINGGSFNIFPADGKLSEGKVLFKAADSDEAKGYFDVVSSDDAAALASASTEVKYSGATIYFANASEAATFVKNHEEAVLKTLVSAKIAEPENLVYDGNTKEATVVLTGIAETDKDKVSAVLEYEYPDGTKNSEAPVNAGNYTATVTGLEGDQASKYELKKSEPIPFTVEKAEANIQVANPGTKTVGDASFKLNATADTNATLEYASSNKSVAEVDETGQVTVKAAGTAILTVSADEVSNYKQSESSVELIVNAPTPAVADISKAKVTLSKTAFTYNGKAQKPSVKSVVLNGKTLKFGTDYTASIASGKKVGTYKVTITAKGSSYSGQTTASFVVNPKGVSKFKVSKAKKAFKAKWTKNKTERSGVQIRYSTKKSMAGAKTVKAKGASVKAKTVKKLKKKTKYYVQARSYKVVNGKTYYSSWSAKKAVKTK